MWEEDVGYFGDKGLLGLAIGGGGLGEGEGEGILVGLVQCEPGVLFDCACTPQLR